LTLHNQLILLAILIALSAFFSGVEIALFSLSRLKIMHLLEKKRNGAEAVARLKSNPHKLLITILVGNNITNIAAASLATVITLELTGSWNIPYSAAVPMTTGIMTFLILIFGEITPKSFASQHAESISLMVARPLELLGIVMWPIIKFFELITSVFRIKVTQRPIVTEDEIKTMVKVGEEEGQLKKIEREMIQNIFKFDDTSVSEIMTPRKYISSISGDITLKEALPILTKSHFSRIPVYENTRYNIIGILYKNDVIKAMHERKLGLKVRKLMMKLYVVPETKRIDNLLQQFQKRKQHMAIAVNEHGEVSGLITIEDVLEEIVGEIIDEKEKVAPLIQQLNKDTYLVQGRTEIEVVSKKLKLQIKKQKEFETLSGFIFHNLGRIPQEGETMHFPKYSIIIDKLDGHRIKEVKIVMK
jgi:putative hemolysin